MRPSVLLICNHPDESGSPGHLDALRTLHERGELSSVDVVYGGARPGETQANVDARVVTAVGDSTCDVVLVLSMKRRVRDLDGIARALKQRPVLYWEGDPWGLGKPVSQEMSGWLSLSEITFSVGGRPQTLLLRRHGARRVIQTIHTYDQVLFAEAERHGGWGNPGFPVAFLASNVMRAPLVSGLPGSWQRFRLVQGLRSDFGPDLLLGGPGWPPGWSVGAVPFADQAHFLRRATVVANWDHYPDIAAYTSDRLAIAMIAGRPQVSTRHPDMRWLPGASAGLFLEDSPGAVRRTCAEVLACGQAGELGAAAHAWARDRISHRQAIRFMLSRLITDMEPPVAQPWADIPQENE